MFSWMSASYTMRQDAFLPIKGVGLVPHVPGLQGAPLPEKGMTAFTWVLPQSIVCPVSIACSTTADRSGWAFVNAALCSLNLVLSDPPVCPT